jgi:hypothetical protein
MHVYLLKFFFLTKMHIKMKNMHSIRLEKLAKMRIRYASIFRKLRLEVDAKTKIKVALSSQQLQI